MTNEQQQLEQAIVVLEAQRAILGDAVVDTLIAQIREKLAALQAPAPPAPPMEQRKQVTVLFADISGFTALSETLDAEDVATTMNALWQVVDAAIINHGGMVDKHIGDAVMALWGAQTAREDDPERAIRGALAVQAALHEFRQRHSLHLAMRIGINTGPVLLGHVGSNAEFTAIGDAVNLASRLEHAAPIGGILISHDTYLNVRGLFEMQTLEPIVIKGKAAPVQTYLIERIKPRAFQLGNRGIEGIKTQMVGRDAEFMQLTDALNAVVAEQQRQAITVLGEAGVGKSRLLYEFWAWVENQPVEVRLLHGRATQAMAQRPYAMLRDVFCFRCDIQDSDSASVAREKLEHGVVATLGTDDADAVLKAHFIGHLIGLNFSDSPHLRGIRDDAKQMRDRALHYVVQFIAALTHTASVLLVLDDLHWADDASLDALTYVTQSCYGLPLMVLGLARRNLLEQRPNWGLGANQQHIMLEPLSASGSRELVEHILHRIPDLPRELRDLIVSGAEGNPFYLEELVKMLIDDGVIIPGEERWTVQAGRLAAVRVPRSLTGILQARLDGLSKPQRNLLQRASVLGRVFWDQAVAQLDDDDPSALLLLDGMAPDTLLHELRRRDLVYQQDVSAFAGSNEYLFKHVLLRDVTYETILKRKRLAYHGQVAEWLIAQSGERVAEHSSLIAAHYEHAENMANAAEWYGRAGEEAQAAYANEEALQYFTKALAMSNAWRWRIGQVEVLHILGRREDEVAALHALAASAAAPPAEVATLWSQYHESVSQFAAADEYANQALVAYRAAGDPTGAARSLAQRGLLARRIGNYEQAKGWYNEALLCLPEYEMLSSAATQTLVKTLNGLGFVDTYLGDYDSARESYTHALQISRQSGNRKGESEALNGMGGTYYYQRNFATAIPYYNQSLETCRAIGNREGEGSSLSNLAIMMRDSGDYAQAQKYLNAALVIQQSIGNRWTEVNIYNDLGILYQELGDFIHADDYFQRAIVISQEIGDEVGEVYVLSNRGTLRRDQGLLDEAEALLGRGLKLIQMQDNKEQEAFLISYLSTVSLRAGRLDEAISRANIALELRHELGLRVRTTAELTTLAEAYWRSGDLTWALDYARQAWVILEECHGEGPEVPQHDYFVCSQIFAAAGQLEDASHALAAAHRLVLDRAANITDPVLRHSFLHNVPINHEIVQAVDGIERTV